MDPESGVPGHLPEEPVRVREVSGPAAPRRVLGGLHHPGARVSHLGQRLVHLRSLSDVVRQGDPARGDIRSAGILSATVEGVDAGVRGQRGAREQDGVQPMTSR
jgi:hypothetical protein